MLFSSIPFIFLFLPITIILYFISPLKYKNFILFIASIIFYFLGEPSYTPLFILSALLNYCGGILIGKLSDTNKKKAILIAGLIINLLLLGAFKYTDFFIGSINSLLNVNIPLARLALPVGISFFTFQGVSYIIDVYRKEAQPQKNFVDFAAYLCMFPQLIAGPIVRYSDIFHQIDPKNRKVTLDAFGAGAIRFTIGLAKKVLIANKLGELHVALTGAANASVLGFWISAAAYAMQIYFDFSGYSDMAIGLGKIFGFTYPENFNYPFIAKSITDFWRRWHMTLGGWFRDYVYFPLGGNRVKTLRYIFNIFVVWSLTGLWHGAAWTFVIWGLFFGVFLSLEKLFLLKPLQKLPALGWIYTQLLVLISFVIFSSGSITSAFSQIKAMFFASGLPFTSYETLYYLKSYFVLLIVAVVSATPLFKNLYSTLSKKFARLDSVISPVAVSAIFIISVAFLIDGSYNPFLYFRF